MPHHLLIECKAIDIKSARTFGKYQIQVEDLPSLNRLQILKFMAAMRLERIMY